MEYADGGDLQGLIKKKSSKGHKFNENFIWQVAFDILSGLKVLHSNKIIHRDIKPANIFFVDGVAKLGDLNFPKLWKENLLKLKLELLTTQVLKYGTTNLTITDAIFGL